MRVPSAKETIAYFSTLGYLVERVMLQPGVGGWKITGSRCPLDGSTFSTKLGLWAEWMDFSAKCIYEAALVEDLMTQWNKADEKSRTSLAVELQQWVGGEPSPRFSKMCLKAPGGSTDHLPRNWKKRIAQLVARDEQLVPFWRAVEDLLSESSPA